MEEEKREEDENRPDSCECCEELTNATTVKDKDKTDDVKMCNSNGNVHSNESKDQSRDNEDSPTFENSDNFHYTRRFARRNSNYDFDHATIRSMNEDSSDEEDEMVTYFNENVNLPQNDPLQEEELDFKYADSDNYTEEIAELYTYSEVQEFDNNLSSYEQILKEWKLEISWQCMKLEERQSIILRLIDLLDVVGQNKYQSIAKNCLLYIAQGCWKEVRSLNDQQEWTIYNVSLLVKNGVLQAAAELLAFEVRKEIETANSGIIKKKNMIDSVQLRITLNLIYTIVETVRATPSLRSFLPCVKCDISDPVGQNHKSFMILLFDMVGLFANGSDDFEHFPIKKIVLLLWKCVLITLGGEEKLKELRSQRRESCKPQSKPDTISYGMNSDDIIRKDFRLVQSSKDEAVADDNSSCNLESSGGTHLIDQKNRNKITQDGIVGFVKKMKSKYFDSTSPLIYDENLIAILPQCIKESVAMLQKCEYVSLGEVQLNWEDKIFNCPMSFKDEFTSIDEIEDLYAAILPNLSLYSTGFSKMLNLIAPTSSTRNIWEVIPDLPIRDSMDRLVRNMDATRHKEIIFKAVSATILLLLKHSKVNHILQFENIAYQLAQNSVISNLAAFFQVESLIGNLKQNYNVEPYNFPNCVLGNLPELTLQEIRSFGPIPGSWRTIFAYINTSRILNKLTKGKSKRVMHLVTLQLFSKFSEALKFKEPMFQHYTIKLLKMQTKYVFKIRDSNLSLLKTLTNVYGKVRTNLNDEWINSKELAYDYRKLWNLADGSYLDPTLRQYIERYHLRKYEYGFGQQVEEETETNYSMMSNSEYCDEDYGEEKLFKDNYEKWLEQEVFNNPIDWDDFLRCNKAAIM